MSEEAKKPEATTPPAGEPRAEAEVAFLTTVSPHIHGRDDIPRIMWTVVIALLPALAASCFFFRSDAARIILVSVAAAVVTEYVLTRLAGGKTTLADGSAVVTGLLVAFVTPSNVPWFIPLIESVFAIGVVKMAFGGLGCNIWNPALAGRAFAMACFAGLMTGGWLAVPATPTTPGREANWVEIGRIPCFAGDECTRADAVSGASALSARKDYVRSLPAPDAITSATPHMRQELASALGRTPRETVKKIQARNNTPLLDMFLGARVGSVGETSALALLIGGFILLVRGVIRWHIPVSFIGAVALLGWLLPIQVPYMGSDGPASGPAWAAGQPLFEVLAGGVMIGAIFMATDMVTSPLSRTGQLIFGFGCGLLTVIIRKYGGYPEGVCYAILLMNTVVPLIDAMTKPRVYGKKR